jgi:hypothetical protein
MPFYETSKRISFFDNNNHKKNPAQGLNKKGVPNGTPYLLI